VLLQELVEPVAVVPADQPPLLDLQGAAGKVPGVAVAALAAPVPVVVQVRRIRAGRHHRCQRHPQQQGHQSAHVGLLV